MWNSVATPAGWNPGDKVVAHHAVDLDEAHVRFHLLPFVLPALLEAPCLLIELILCIVQVRQGGYLCGWSSLRSCRSCLRSETSFSVYWHELDIHGEDGSLA